MLPEQMVWKFHEHVLRSRGVEGGKSFRTVIRGGIQLVSYAGVCLADLGSWEPDYGRRETLNEILARMGGFTEVEQRDTSVFDTNVRDGGAWWISSCRANNPNEVISLADMKTLRLFTDFANTTARKAFHSPPTSAAGWKALDAALKASGISRNSYYDTVMSPKFIPVRESGPRIVRFAVDSYDAAEAKGCVIKTLRPLVGEGDRAVIDMMHVRIAMRVLRADELVIRRVTADWGPLNGAYIVYPADAMVAPDGGDLSLFDLLKRLGEGTAAAFILTEGGYSGANVEPLKKGLDLFSLHCALCLAMLVYVVEIQTPRRKGKSWTSGKR